MFQLPSTLLWPLATSLVLCLFSWGKYALYPFRLFTTWVHECSHATSASLLGGQVQKITLAPDTSGLTVYQLPKSRVRQAIVASSGYLGSSLVGCALYLASVSNLDSRTLVIGIGVTLALSLLFWIRGAFGMITVTLLAATFLALGHYGNHAITRPVFAFLAIQTALGALLDIRTLFGLGHRTRSDAHDMQSLLVLPSWFWALLWMGTSVALMLYTLDFSRTHFGVS